MTTVSMDVPRPEYPRPQLRRERWMNLNGTWDFEFDAGDSGLERGLLDRPLNGRIIVPFAPESELSGIGDVDFHEAVWYRRQVEIPDNWSGQRLIVHFGAVDHDATVWVDGEEVIRHRGGFTSFEVDITHAVAGKRRFVLTVRARDSRHDWQARGKQSTWYGNSECFYTRTTGIWQTVWIEPVPDVHIRRLAVTPHVGQSLFEIAPVVSVNAPGHTVHAMLTDERGAIIAQAEADLASDLTPTLFLGIPEGSVHLWEPGRPYLYGLSISVRNMAGEVVDMVESYAGLRSVTINGTDLLINGRPVFQRLVLDQGYWPQSLMTAPSDQALVDDIVLSMKAGFNGARLHQKVFEERYLYHADRLGYLVWGEFGDWGVSSGIGPKGANQHPTASFITQWIEAVTRDYSHPSIVGWCGLNETYQAITDRITDLDDVTRGMFLAAKGIDPTRPVLDASGYSHRVVDTDVYDAHNYEQDPSRFAELFGPDAEPFVNTSEGSRISLPYAGQPYFVSEYGGIWWNASLAAASKESGGDCDQDRSQSWGYGARVGSEEEFYDRFAGLTEVLCANGRHFGYCYTQLTDVYQEENGIYDFSRKPKFDIARIHDIQVGLAHRYGRGE